MTYHGIFKTFYDSPPQKNKLLYFILGTIVWEYMKVRRTGLEKQGSQGSKWNIAENIKCGVWETNKEYGNIIKMDELHAFTPRPHCCRSLRQNESSTFALIYRLKCSNSTPPLSFAHFPSFNLICSGQVAAYKQSTHARLMMQRHTAPAYCVHIFANLLL